ncbi:MAG: hypothetical protein JNJ55_03445, partial [Betaproteobacteria bacterium]|nr:hypothetical protein [Betaproteobacteria bacterium]
MANFMRAARCGILVAILHAAGHQAFAQVISTAAGGGAGADGGAAVSASLNAPHGVALDSAGNIYIADTANHRIRRVDSASGVISTVAGTGVAGFNGDGIAATSAQINLPVGIAVNATGDVFFSEFGGQRIRKIAQATGFVSTVAGTGGAGNFNGDAIAATTATLGAPRGIALDAAGNLYFASRDHHRVRKIDAGSGLISTVAGTGTSSVTGGYNGDSMAATSAQLFYPDGVAVAANGEVF